MNIINLITRHHPWDRLLERQPIRWLVGRYEAKHLVHWLMIAVSIGVVAGLGAALFHFLLSSMTAFSMVTLANFYPPLAGGDVGGPIPPAPPAGAAAHVRNWMFLIIPTVGGLLSGFLVYHYAPEAEGHGTDAVIKSFHRQKGHIRPIVPAVKLIASVLTIGTGGSAGREGPIAQIGAGFGSLMGRRLKMSDDEIRLMVLIGAGAGIGAIFRAPIGGAIFGASVAYRETDLEYDVLMPGFIASIVAYSIFILVSGQPFVPIFTLHSEYTLSLLHLPFFLLLGLVLVPFSTLYIRFFYGLRDVVFRRLPVPRSLLPAIGGLGLGVMAFFNPDVLGAGYGLIQQALDGSLALHAMVALVFLKILATSLTISSGGSGGVFAPSLIIGGMVGGVAGLLLNHWNPTLFNDPAVFVFVGMAAFFAAAAKVPIASLIMVSEMTGGYSLLVPAMLSIAVAYLLSSRRVSIYEEQTLNRMASPAHRGEYVVDVLEDIRVGEVAQPHDKESILAPDTPLQAILDVFTKSKQTVFPVVGKDEEVVGLIPLDTLRSIPPDLLMANLLIAHDLMDRPEFLHPADNLNTALQKLLSTGLGQIPVVDETKRLAGILSRQELLSVYSKRIREMTQK